MKYLRDIDGVTHCNGAIAAGEFALCGLSTDGETGNAIMGETSGPINCDNCLAIIRHCKSLKRYQLARN